LAKILCLLLIACTSATLVINVAWAQSIISGEVTGVVTDSAGAIVPNATVTLTSKEMGTTQTVTTNTAGGFRFPLLRPGVYTVSVKATGFSIATEDVTVGVGQVTTASLQLRVGAISETIEVSGAAPLLETENANLATTYTPSQIENIPSPGGDLTNFALSAPGVVLSTGAGYGNFTAYGMPGTSNLFTVNGGDMNDPYSNLNNSGSSNNMLGQNEIQEVAIVHNGYTGQYGRGASINMNFTTKSGGNSFHGNAVWDWNGRYLDANDWFNNNTNTPRPFANSNQWGGSFGGPIVKNKLFFFFDSEGLRYVLPGGGLPVFVPTTQWASAVQANIDANQPAESGFYQKMFALYAGAPGGGSATPLSGDGGCGDLATTPTGTTLINGIAFGTGAAPCTKTFRSLLNNLNKERLMSVRVDYVLSENDRLNWRYWQDRGTQPTYTDPINPGFNQLSVQPQDAGQFTWNHLFNANLVNQLIVGGFYYSAIFGTTTKAVALFPTTIGVQAATNTCYLLNGNLSCMGGETYRYPNGRNVSQYQLVDDLSWTKGNHGLKFGVNFRRIDFADYGPGSNLTGDLRMSSMTDFSNGVLSNAGGSVLRQQFSPYNDRQVNNYSLGFYGQDEWRVNSSLKLTLSLRLDRNSNETCPSNCFAHFSGDFLGGMSHNAATPYNQSVLVGQSGLFSSLERIVWEPRAGFAWSPAFHRGTVVRGGAGIFSDLYPAQLSTLLLSNPPNAAIWNIAVSSGGADLPIAPGVANGAFAQAAANNAAFVNGFAGGGTLASIQAAVPGFSGPSFYTTTPHMVNPRYAEWNLELEQAFGDKMVASVNYVGNHGSKLLIRTNGTNAFVKPTPTNPCPTFGSLPCAPMDPRFGTVTNITNNGISNYNGLTASLSRRLTKGFTGTLSYTYSHSLDNISNAGIDQYSLNQTGDSVRYQVDPQNGRLNYGNADYDFRHVLNLNYVWDVPFMAKNRWIGGWTIAGVLFKRTGEPYSAVNTTIPGALLGNYTTTGSLVMADFLGGPTPSCTVNHSSNPANNQQTNAFACLTSAQFADTAASNVTQADFGNIARNSFRGPRYFDTDFSIRKTFLITENGLAFTLGANAYNILNHPNFGNPDSVVTSSTFGTVQNTVTPASSPYGNFQGAAVSGRILQLELKLKF
jgi:Carboxypeptidase regulatory-like domain/TonB dependent receptor-like, beta-barrel